MSGLDDELERLLRQYRVSDPPAQLRDQIVAEADQVVAQAFPGAPKRRWREGGRPADQRSIIEWLPAVAAVILATVFYWLAGIERQYVEARLSTVPPVEQMTVDIQVPHP